MRCKGGKFPHRNPNTNSTPVPSLEETIAKYSFINEAHTKNPHRNFVFTAIESLTNPLDILVFYKQYVQFTTEFYKLSSSAAEKSVNENLGYIVDYYDTEVSALWKESLPFLEHPIFSKVKPPTGEVLEYCVSYKKTPRNISNAIQELLFFSFDRTNKELSKAASSYAKEYVDNLNNSLSLAGVFATCHSVVIPLKISLTDAAGANYAAVNVSANEEEGNPYTNKELYFLVLGVVNGTKKYISNTYGVVPEISIDVL